MSRAILKLNSNELHFVRHNIHYAYATQIEELINMKNRERNYNIFQQFVEEMVNTDTIVTNTGVFEYKGKQYILIAEIKEINSSTSHNTDYA